MRTVGNRRDQQITELPSGEALIAGARFSESLARGMGLLAAGRSRGGVDEPTGNT